MAGVTFQPMANAEALRYFAGKVPMSAEAATALSDEAKQRAFFAAGVAKEDVAADLHSALLRNLREGKSFGDFKKEAQKLSGLSTQRLDLIYRQNVHAAYQAGRYRQMRDPAVLKLRPYWQYLHFPQERFPRPDHLALHQKVVAADDPFWKQWYPPNGYGCKCSVRTLSDRQVRDLGLEPQTGDDVTGLHELPDGRSVQVIAPDPGFSGSPETYWEQVARGATAHVRATAAFEPLSGPADAGPIKAQGGPTAPPHAGGRGAAALAKAAGIALRGEVLAGADGGPVLLTPGLLKRASVEASRLPSLRDVLEHPDEVWISGYADKKASVVMRRTYLRVLDTAGEGLVLVAEVERGALIGYKAVTEREAQSFRVGQRLFNARS